MFHFTLGLSPRLQAVKWPEWERNYPDGVGASAFSSPAWQRLMLKLVGPHFELCTLVGSVGSRKYSLPVFARHWKFGRVELVTQPIAYFVLPTECESADASCIRTLVAAARTPLTSKFKWWLPPWMSGDRSLTTADVDTYVIELEGTVDGFLQRSVRKRFLEYVRTSYRRGIEVIEHPGCSQIQEYFTLYENTFRERNWDGERFPFEFFVGVTEALGEAGRLVLLQHRARIVGGGVVLFDRYAVHYFQGAIDRECSEVKPHMVLYDWLLRAAAKRGLRYVDLGGINAGNERLADFKRGWGAKATAVPHISWTLDRQALARRIGFGRLREESRSEIGASAERETENLK